MRLLLDTSVLLWVAAGDARLPPAAQSLIEEPDNRLFVSAASLWEIAIKAALDRPDFQVDVRALRRGLAENGYEDLPVRGEHASALARLPPLHKDPFDRMLVAQATVDGLTLLTADSRLAAYPGPILAV